MTIPSLLARLEGRLVVSCQASEGDAFRNSAALARFARAAVDGGAVAIRANGVEDIRAIRSVVDVPVIGIDKHLQDDGQVLITPSFKSAQDLHDAGAGMVALDCSIRGQQAGALPRIRKIKSELGTIVLADISTVEEALAALDAGADAVLSTLRGYTAQTAHIQRFEPSFIADLVEMTRLPVIAEGRIHSPEDATAAMKAGAFAVIIGSAITRPADITRRFVSAVHRSASNKRGTRYFAGVDLGGTNTKYGLVSSHGELVFESFLPTPAHEGRGALLTAVVEAVTDTQLKAASRSLEVSSIGVATAGWVNPLEGSIVYATENLPKWTGTRVAEHVTATCGLPVSVENDANALAIAERYFGAGQGLDHFAVITLGTGVGGGCYINGRLNRGSHFFANAFGHIPLIPDGHPCSCGRRGCLETYANSAAFLRYTNGSYTSVQQIVEAAKIGETTAVEATRSLAAHLARGCASIVGLLDPEVIIIAGGVATGNPLLIKFLEEELEPLVPSWEQRKLRIVGSQLGYFGGVIGAAALAMESADRALPA